MIPTLLLAGLLVGRVWMVPVTAVAWAGALLAGGVATGPAWQFALGAGALAAANTLVGVAVHRAVVLLARRRPPVSS